MASHVQGYDEERFVSTISRNFLCLICFNVLKDPVLCARNQHCFCRGCITKHLENSRRCPTCADELTEETLTESNRIVKDYLNELNIHCIYQDRGCQEIVQLQHLDQHEDSCGFTPVVCGNQDCGAILNKRDLIHHESELCEYRKLKCHSCGEMTKTLADTEKRTEQMETKQANVEKNMQTKLVNLEKSMETKLVNLEEKFSNLEKFLETRINNTDTTIKNNTAIIKTRMANVETKMVNMKTDIEGKLDVVNTEVKEFKKALAEAFDQMKDVLIKEDNIKENARKVRNAPSGDRENIIVAGGEGNDSVEMFNWRRRTWSPLQFMPTKRQGATSFVYNNQLVIAGGQCRCDRVRLVDNMIRINVDPPPDLSTHWIDCVMKLPVKLVHHSSVLYNDKLMVTGGYDGNARSDKIHEVQVVPPYTVRTLSKMSEPRQGHCTEIFDDSLLILGGKTTFFCQDNLSSVALYDIKNGVCKQLTSLPYEVSLMATVKWGDNVAVIGGLDKRGKALNTVVMYNVKTEQSHMLPPMRYERYGCTAVVVGNNIVVLGGMNQKRRALETVEYFNFERNNWQELLEMPQARCYHTAVVV